MMQEPNSAMNHADDSSASWGWPSAREWCVIAIGLAACFGVFFSATVNTDTFKLLNQHSALISQARAATAGATLTVQLQPHSLYANQLTADFIKKSQDALHLLVHENTQHQPLPASWQSGQEEQIQTAIDIGDGLLATLAASRSANVASPSFANIKQPLYQLEQLLIANHDQLNYQLNKQLNRSHAIQLALAAITLIITAAIVFLLRRAETQHRANQYFLERSEASAKRAADQLQHVIDGSELGFYDWDYESGSVRVNNHWLQSLGLPLDQLELNIESFMARVHPEDLQTLQQDLQQCFETGAGYNLEYRMQHQQGHWVWFEGSGKAVEMNPNQPDRVARICGTLKDIHQRKHAELEYRENEQRFRKLIEALPTVAVQGYNKEREVIYWNDASRRVYGYSKQEALGSKLEQLIIPEPMREAVKAAHQAWVNEGQEIPAAELQLLHKDGHLVPVFSSHVMLQQDSDSPEMFCVDVDLTEQHETAAELKRLATRDLLTNLPNRRFLEDELNRRLAEAERFGQQLAVLFVDLDLFKEVNDSMGHNAGDHLLQQVADRLKDLLRHYDTLSRFGGDEFIIILPNVTGRHEVQAVADKVMAEFEQTFRLQEQDIYVTASIGMSMYPEDGDSTVELLKYADAAMYQAKDSGRNRYRFFATSMNEQLNRQRAIAGALRQSLEGDDFHLVFQPQIDFNDYHIQACEALLRWQPNDTSLQAMPSEFIPIAERSDLMIRLGQWVIRSACRQLSKWRAQGLPHIRIDLNISGKQLHQSSFFNFLNEVLDEYGLQASDFGIELTEDVLTGADSNLLAQLTHMRDAGMKIAVDDFGSGYSSLNFLKHFSVDTLKIDRALIAKAPESAKEQAILEAIVQLGHKLNLQIVAEGIETELQAVFCKQLGCDQAQGFLYHKPMPAPQLAQLLTS
ncbi:bifunctional diguanylate cyclase/phosphodiesterase [Neiella holothuriorum]|nr:bifunctional diguanylate cyclase/phosphodiesterase [Neiella holothuriorum]